MDKDKNFSNIFSCNDLSSFTDPASHCFGIEINNSIATKIEEDTTYESLVDEYDGDIPSLVMIDWLASNLPEAKEARRRTN